MEFPNILLLVSGSTSSDLWPQPHWEVEVRSLPCLWTLLCTQLTRSLWGGRNFQHPLFSLASKAWMRQSIAFFSVPCAGPSWFAVVFPCQAYQLVLRRSTWQYNGLIRKKTECFSLRKQTPGLRYPPLPRLYLGLADYRTANVRVYTSVQALPLEESPWDEALILSCVYIISTHWIILSP